MQETLKTRCNRCKRSDFVVDKERGELICKNCGLVLKEKIMDKSQEWRAFTLEERLKRKRVGSPISYSKYDKGLSTSIKVSKDTFGRSLSPTKRRNFYRLRKLNLRSRLDSKNRNLLKAMSELDRVTDKIHLPKSIKEKAAVIYRRALEEGLVKGRSILAIVTASLYAACRLTETPRSLEDLADKTLMKKREIARSYRLLLRKQKLKMPIDTSSKYVSKIASETDLETKIEFKAIEILEQARKIKATTGKNPRGIAAAALYMASQLEGGKVTQKELAKASDVTEVTVRNRYKELKEKLNTEV
jgi:transcription initiation factor TFIIB